MAVGDDDAREEALSGCSYALEPDDLPALLRAAGLSTETTLILNFWTGARCLLQLPACWQTRSAPSPARASWKRGAEA